MALHRILSRINKVNSFSRKTLLLCYLSNQLFSPHILRNQGLFPNSKRGGNSERNTAPELAHQQASGQWNITKFGATMRMTSNGVLEKCPLQRRWDRKEKVGSFLAPITVIGLLTAAS